MIWHSANAMNYAFVKFIARVMEQPVLVKPYRRHPAIVSRGEELLAMVEAQEDTGFAGDRRLTDKWAEHLGVRNWYEWRLLSDLPQHVRHIWQEGPS
jgi:hypothetical protein